MKILAWLKIEVWVALRFRVKLSLFFIKSYFAVTAVGLLLFIEVDKRLDFAYGSTGGSVEE